MGLGHPDPRHHLTSRGQARCSPLSRMSFVALEKSDGVDLAAGADAWVGLRQLSIQRPKQPFPCRCSPCQSSETLATGPHPVQTGHWFPWLAPEAPFPASGRRVEEAQSPPSPGVQQMVDEPRNPPSLGIQQRIGQAQALPILEVHRRPGLAATVRILAASQVNFQRVPPSWWSNPTSFAGSRERQSLEESLWCVTHTWVLRKPGR